MSHSQKKLAVALGALVLLVSIFSVFAREKEASIQPESEVPSESLPRRYTDAALHFSIELPSRVVNIQKMGQAIYFRGSAGGKPIDGPLLFVIIAEPTLYSTTEDWLATQPKGNASSQGYELIRWIGPRADGKALVAEYVGPGDDSTYRKRFRMMTVKNNGLYTVDIDAWHQANAVLTIDSDIERALKTFQTTGLVTTDSTGSYRTIQNWLCDATFHIPPNWSDHGILGESKIVSPEDERINEKWANANQELFQNAEGEGPVGPDARSLYISCQYTVKRDDLESRALKIIKISGQDAYEIADTGKMPDGASFTNYMIVLEKEKVMEIHLGQTEYDNLSDTVKQIIQSISFEN